MTATCNVMAAYQAVQKVRSEFAKTAWLPAHDTSCAYLLSLECHRLHQPSPYVHDFLTLRRQCLLHKRPRSRDRPVDDFHVLALLVGWHGFVFEAVVRGQHFMRL